MKCDKCGGFVVTEYDQARCLICGKATHVMALHKQVPNMTNFRKLSKSARAHAAHFLVRIKGLTPQYVAQRWGYSLRGLSEDLQRAKTLGLES